MREERARKARAKNARVFRTEEALSPAAKGRALAGEAERRGARSRRSRGRTQDVRARAHSRTAPRPASGPRQTLGRPAHRPITHCDKAKSSPTVGLSKFTHCFPGQNSLIVGWSKNTTNITLIVLDRPETKYHQLEGERWGFVCAVCLFRRFGWFCKRGDPVPSVTGGAFCFRWVYRLRTYVGNVTKVE